MPLNVNVNLSDEPHKPPKLDDHKLLHQRLAISPLSAEDMHRHSPLMLSPRNHHNSLSKNPLSGGGEGGSVGGSHHGKWNCLCSPTTHAGSFRCRLHRGTGLSRAHHSVGANLSELASKSPNSIIDSLRAQ